MLATEQLSAFLLVAMLITISPGPDNLMVLAMGMSKGRKQGMAFGLGAAMGCLSHTLLAVVGVSALIAASPAAFAMLKVGGGLYLVWLGINALRSAGVVRVAAVKDDEQALSRLFLKGVLANAVNPKVVLFFLSFLPQFVMPSHGQVEWQMAMLGLVFTAQATVLLGLLGYFSGAVGQWLATRSRWGAVLDRVAGSVLIMLGLRLVVSA